MNTQTLKNAIDAIESAADKAMAALKKGQVDADLQQRVEDLNQQARTKRSLNDPDQLQQAVLDIERSSDRARQACRSAAQVDPALQQSHPGCAPTGVAAEASAASRSLNP